MKVVITYCSKWNYLPRASSLEAELSTNFNAEITLNAGTDGVYDVVIDDILVFSKKDVGRFPEEGEIVQIIQKRMD